ncbi:hypothetical protein HQ563_18245 [bacterium]|nr:hypothetical protein [bacterium]
MAGDINAIGILIVPVATAFLVVKFGRLPRHPRVVLIAIVLPFVVADVSVNLASMRALDLRERSPDPQCLVPCICLGLIMMFVRPTCTRLWAAIGAIAAAFALSHHYLELVDTDEYTGDPFRVLSRNDALERLKLRVLGEILSDLPHPDTTSYPEGWLSESRIATLHLRQHPKTLTIYQEEYVVDFAIKSYDVLRLWHTSITSLYRTKPKTLEIWYPGGAIKNSIDRLEFRERESRREPRARHRKAQRYAQHLKPPHQDLAPKGIPATTPVVAPKTPDAHRGTLGQRFPKP